MYIWGTLYTSITAAIGESAKTFLTGKQLLVPYFAQLYLSRHRRTVSRGFTANAADINTMHFNCLVTFQNISITVPDTYPHPLLVKQP